MAFCERQWALIHIEQAWAENVRTVEGHQLHERVDDPNQDETRGDRLIIRAMPIISRRLGLQGVADVVEFLRSENSSENTCILPERNGNWIPYPIEYKRGNPKPDDRDAVQLCAQAMALEEMLHVEVTEGALFYGQIRRREKVLLDSSLREKTMSLSQKMHLMWDEGKTPSAIKGKHCNLCSLIEICQPQISSSHKSVKKYIDSMLREGGVSE